MKLELLLLMPLLFLFESCKEDSPQDLRSEIRQIYSGDATSIKNGENWSAWVRLQGDVNGNILINGQFNLVIDVFNDQGFWRESLGISKVNRIKTSQIISSADYYTLIDDGDVAGDDYGLDTLATNNFIQITDVDTVAMEISGIFNVSFILERKGNGTPENPPLNIRFTEGQFTTKVEQEWFE